MYLVWLALLIVVGLFVAYPAITLVWNSLLVDGQFSLYNFERVFTRNENFTALINSLSVSLWATLGGVLIGVSLAWVVTRTDVPGRGFFRTILIVPYLIPPFIGAIAWIYLLGPVGYVNEFWMWLTGSWDPLVRLYGKWGVVFVMILYGYPIPYIVTVGPFSRMDASLEEAAQMSGASPWRTMRDITLPLMMPSIFSGAVLLFMFLLGNFGIPAVIGFPDRFYVLTTRIYLTVLNFDLEANLQLAAALSMLLVGVAILTMQAQRLLLRRGSYTVIAGKHTTPQLVRLRRWRWPVFAALLVFVCLTTFAPILAIVATSLTRAYGIPLGAGNFTWDNYASLFQLPAVHRAIRNSLFLAAATGTVVALLGTILAYLNVKARARGAGVLEALVAIPYAVPGTVVALSMILAFLKPLPIVDWALYNTIWLLLVAYVARFLVLGVRTVGSNLHQIDDTLEEVARMSGASPWRSFADVVWPLIRPGLVAAWFLAAIPSLTELTLSALLWAVGNETIGVLVYSLHEEGKMLLTAALSVVLIIVVLVLNVTVRAVTRGKLGF